MAILPFIGDAQTFEAAYSAWDDQFEEFKIHINEDEFVEAIRQFGRNPFRRWNFRFENLEGDFYTGYMQLKREGDINYWDLVFDNEHLYITTIYANDVFTWKVVHDDKQFTFTAEDRFGLAWEDRFVKEFDWNMYQEQEGELASWYIDDTSEENMTMPMRLAAIMVVLELSAFGQ